MVERLSAGGGGGEGVLWERECQGGGGGFGLWERGGLVVVVVEICGVEEGWGGGTRGGVWRGGKGGVGFCGWGRCEGMLFWAVVGVNVEG